MLEVTRLLEVAAGGMSAASCVSRAPARYAAAGSEAPAVVVWNVCGHCNLWCPHCYAAARRRPSPADLSTTDGLRLLDELAAAGVRVVILSGGEPLLRPDLFVLAAHARGLGLAAQLSTNGTLIDADVAGRLAAAGVGYVGVSLDGLAAFNDGYRGMPGAFERATAGTVAARRAGLRTGLRMTLTSRNVGAIAAVLDHAVAVGADRFYLSHLLYAGRGRRLVREDLTALETREALLALFDRAERLRVRGVRTAIVTGGNDSDGVLFVKWVEDRRGGAAAEAVRQVLAARGGNAAGERILSIDARGNVHPDQFWQSATLGNVRRQRFADILDHPLRRALHAREGMLRGRCGGCAHVALCRGSHRERALARHGNVWASDPACVMSDAEIGGEPMAAAGGMA